MSRTIQANGKTYQPGEFVCEWCKTPLVLDTYYTIDGKNVCQSCRNKERCASCGFLITETKYVTLDDKTYHPDCFRCSECIIELTGKFFFEDNALFCGECINLRGAGPDEELCPKCFLPLSGGIIKALGKRYHEDCFVCHSCFGDFPNDEFVNVKGNPYCDTCIDNESYLTSTAHLKATGANPSTSSGANRSAPGSGSGSGYGSGAPGSGSGSGSGAGYGSGAPGSGYGSGSSSDYGSGAPGSGGYGADRSAPGSGSGYGSGAPGSGSGSGYGSGAPGSGSGAGYGSGGPGGNTSDYGSGAPGSGGYGADRSAPGSGSGSGYGSGAPGSGSGAPGSGSGYGSGAPGSGAGGANRSVPETKSVSAPDDEYATVVKNEYLNPASLPPKGASKYDQQKKFKYGGGMKEERRKKDYKSKAALGMGYEADHLKDMEGLGYKTVRRK